MNQRAARGLRAESTALRWLKKRGLVPVMRNYRCRYGELDLIMQDQSTLVIVEVRARAEASYVSPALSIDHRKQGKIIRASEYFLQQYPTHADKAVRFDVIAIIGDQENSIEWLRDAFTVD